MRELFAFPTAQAVSAEEELVIERRVMPEGIALTARGWPKEISVSQDVLDVADPQRVSREGDRLTRSVENGTAVYRLQQRREAAPSVVSRGFLLWCGPRGATPPVEGDAHA